MLERAHALNGFTACQSVASRSAVISSDEKSWFVEPVAKEDTQNFQQDDRLVKEGKVAKESNFSSPC